MSTITGKVVLITGAARGIGAHTAREVVRRGGKVALVGLEPTALAALAAELGEDRATAFEADVTDFAAMQRAAEHVIATFGGIDVVLANAGVAPFGTVRTIDPPAFQKTMDINVVGVFHTIRAALDSVIERRGYVMIVASVASFAPTAGLPAYNASKAAAEALGAAMQGEVLHKGVDVGIVHPSWIDTDMVRDAEADLPSFRALRKRLPWPVRATTSVEDCVQAIVDGMESRANRVFIPKEVRLVRRLRDTLGSRRSVRVQSKVTAGLIDQMEDEVLALGRSLSEREQHLNTR